MQQFSTKDPEETITLTFDFSRALDDGDTLTGTPVCTASVVDGTDPTPSAIISGTSVVGSPATEVYQNVIAGVNGVDYAVRCKAVSAAGKTLVCAGLLPVRKAEEN